MHASCIFVAGLCDVHQRMFCRAPSSWPASVCAGNAGKAFVAIHRILWEASNSGWLSPGLHACAPDLHPAEAEPLVCRCRSMQGSCMQTAGTSSGGMSHPATHVSCLTTTCPGRLSSHTGEAPALGFEPQQCMRHQETHSPKKSALSDLSTHASVAAFEFQTQMQQP